MLAFYPNENSFGCLETHWIPVIMQMFNERKAGGIVFFLDHKVLSWLEGKGEQSKIKK